MSLFCAKAFCCNLDIDSFLNAFVGKGSPLSIEKPLMGRVAVHLGPPFSRNDLERRLCVLIWPCETAAFS